MLIELGLPILAHAAPVLGGFVGDLIAKNVPPKLGQVLGFAAETVGRAVRKFGDGSPQLAAIVGETVEAIKPALDHLEAHGGPWQEIDLVSYDAMMNAMRQAEAKRREAGDRLDSALDRLEGGASPRDASRSGSVRWSGPQQQQGAAPPAASRPAPDAAPAEPITETEQAAVDTPTSA